MVRYELRPHPGHPARAVQEISVELRGGGDDVLLTWSVKGYDSVAVPEWRSPARTDDLWRTTCFELFLNTGNGHYVEFNFSPSTQWAAYAFEDYRSGMALFDCAVPPLVERLLNGIEVDCDLGGLPDGALTMALSAVIEEIDGTKSYWALAHAPGPPDFHNPACFTATLPPPAGT